MSIIIGFLKKTWHIIKHAPLLTGIVLTSIILTVVTVIQVGAENLPNTWASTPVFAVMMSDPDFPDIQGTEYASDEDDPYYDTDTEDPDVAYYTDPIDTDTEIVEPDDKPDTQNTSSSDDDQGSDATEKDNTSTENPDNPGDSDEPKSKEEPKDDGLVRDGVTVYETYKPHKSKSDC